MAVGWVVFMPPQCIAWDFVFGGDCLRCVPAVGALFALTAAYNRGLINYVVRSQYFDLRAVAAGAGGVAYGIHVVISCCSKTPAKL